MSNTTAYDLIDKTWGMKPSKKKSELFLRAFELLWNEGKKIEAFETRLDEIESRTFSGDEEQALVALAWCLAEYQKEKELYTTSAYFLLWYLKNNTSNLGYNINIPRKKVEEQLAFFQQFAAEHGYGDQAYYQQAAATYKYFGELKPSLELYEKSFHLAEDNLSDCDACVIQGVGEVLFNLGKREEFFARTTKIREGKTECTDSTLFAWADTALYYLKKGNFAQAQEFAIQAVTETVQRTEDPNIRLHADYIVVMTLTDKIDAALSHIERYCDLAYKQHNQLHLLRWIEALVVLCDQLQTDAIVLHLKNTPWMREDNTYSVKKLRAILETEAKVIAQKADTRNGNTYYSDTYNYYSHATE